LKILVMKRVREMEKERLEDIRGDRRMINGE
jgi:hypothetical protein